MTISQRTGLHFTLPLRKPDRLLDRFRNLIQARGWTQAQAAERFGVSQARVSALVRGKWQKFSLDMRVMLAARAGQRGELAA